MSRRGVSAVELGRTDEAAFALARYRGMVGSASAVPATLAVASEHNPVPLRDDQSILARIRERFPQPPGTSPAA